MQRLIVSSLFLFSGLGLLASAQQTPSTNDSDKPRIFVTDSNSWSTQGAAGGTYGTFAAESSGGARPQTAEIIKTFGQRCPQVTVNNKVNLSNYVVELDHEGARACWLTRTRLPSLCRRRAIRSSANRPCRSAVPCRTRVRRFSRTGARMRLSFGLQLQPQHRLS